EQVRSDPTLSRLFDQHESSKLRGELEKTEPGRALLEKLADFLDDYGHRESVLSTALQPTWKDAPESVLEMIKGLARAPARPAPGQPQWEAARDAVLRHPLFRLS